MPRRKLQHCRGIRTRHQNNHRPNHKRCRTRRSELRWSAGRHRRRRRRSSEQGTHICPRRRTARWGTPHHTPRSGSRPIRGWCNCRHTALDPPSSHICRQRMIAPQFRARCTLRSERCWCRGRCNGRRTRQGRQDRRTPRPRRSARLRMRWPAGQNRADNGKHTQSQRQKYTL